MSIEDFLMEEWPIETKKSSPPRIPKNLLVPGSLSELERLSQKKNCEDWFLYAEIYDRLGVVRQARAIITDDDVKAFCQSYMESSSLHQEMFQDGQIAQNEQMVVENIKRFLETLDRVRSDAITRQLFTPRKK